MHTRVAQRSKTATKIIPAEIEFIKAAGKDWIVIDVNAGGVGGGLNILSLFKLVKLQAGVDIRKYIESLAMLEDNLKNIKYIQTQNMTSTFYHGDRYFFAPFLEELRKQTAGKIVVRLTIFSTDREKWVIRECLGKDMKEEPLPEEYFRSSVAFFSSFFPKPQSEIGWDSHTRRWALFNFVVNSPWTHVWVYQNLSPRREVIYPYSNVGMIFPNSESKKASLQKGLEKAKIKLGDPGQNIVLKINSYSIGGAYVVFPENLEDKKVRKLLRKHGALVSTYYPPASIKTPFGEKAVQVRVYPMGENVYYLAKLFDLGVSNTSGYTNLIIIGNKNESYQVIFDEDPKRKGVIREIRPVSPLDLPFDLFKSVQDEVNQLLLKVWNNIEEVAEKFYELLPDKVQEMIKILGYR